MNAQKRLSFVFILLLSVQLVVVAGCKEKAVMGANISATGPKNEQTPACCKSIPSRFGIPKMQGVQALEAK